MQVRKQLGTVEIKVKTKGRRMGELINRVAAELREKVPNLLSLEPTKRLSAKSPWSKLTAAKMTKFTYAKGKLTVKYLVWHVTKGDIWGR